MTTALHLGRIIGVLTLAVVLAGCSAIKLGYNNFDAVAYWWLDGYVDFDDSQSQRVRTDLARLQAWHRATELPRLGELMQRVERLVGGELTPAQACALVPDLRARIAAVTERAEPAIVTLAMSLTPAQLQHLERKYGQNNREYTRDWLRLSAAEQADKRGKQWAERAEMIYGRLGEAQRAALRQQLEQSSFDPQRVLADRQRRQQDLLHTLRKVTTAGVPLDEARSLMRGWIGRGLQAPDPAQRAHQEAMIQESCRIVAALHQSSTAEQRDHAVRRLRAYQRDLGDLTADR